MPLFIDYLLSSNVTGVIIRAGADQILSPPDLRNSGNLLHYWMSNHLSPTRHHSCSCSASGSRGAIPCWNFVLGKIPCCRHNVSKIRQNIFHGKSILRSTFIWKAKTSIQIKKGRDETSNWKYLPIVWNFCKCKWDHL